MPGAYVIVGANLAGESAATTLREEGSAREIVLVGEEPQPPYERPPLSKQYLRGEIAFEKLLFPKPRAYEDRSIALRLAGNANRRQEQAAGPWRNPHRRD